MNWRKGNAEWLGLEMRGGSKGKKGRGQPEIWAYTEDGLQEMLSFKAHSFLSENIAIIEGSTCGLLRQRSLAVTVGTLWPC